MSAYLWPLSRTTVLDLNGDLVAGAWLNFWIAGTTTPLVAYADSALTAPLPNVIEADASGRWPAVYLPYTDYRQRVRTPGGTLLFDDDGIANPAPASSGGGGSIPASERFQTGDTKWSFDPGPLSGFVRLNARTIGNAGSGATERANDDTEDLYIWLWDRLTDAICPVSSGRGATGAADFAAGKTLQLPSMRGRAPFGLDDMGNSAANVLQVSTTVTTTNASATATVGSASGLVVGMYVVSENIPAGTTISAISGTTVTLSTGAGVTAGTNKAARFSLFSDAQQAGAAGGASSLLLTAGQLPANIPNSASTSTTVGAPSGFNVMLNVPGNFIGYSGGGSQSPNAGNLVSFLNASSSTSVTINAGGGQAHGNLPPGILVTWFIKL
ncbi:hypothetical protein [Bosea sp. (in: a-proteobacteria)]|uniref:hypothetical protein n=1 Tax=Bosea sp. (in: a-proteobacteria) TaxID=1871050 RepID=UPI00261D3DF0|nr:hypothetical protein [Bosea sp. (in: a-proteobacteria)]MCO5092676.1 hypothetical protein [Bosea sp. (in: a-proteobacteria)]